MFLFIILFIFCTYAKSWTKTCMECWQSHLYYVICLNAQKVFILTHVFLAWWADKEYSHELQIDWYIKLFQYLFVY